MAQTQIHGARQIKAGTVSSLVVDSSIIIASGVNAFTGNVNFGGFKGTNLADPTNPQEIATKNYVDLRVSGLAAIKDPVRAATTANITLSGTQTVDGIALSAGDRVLVKNQTLGQNNGIYVVSAGAWTRSTDADSNTEVVAGMAVWVNEGTTNGDKRFVITTDNPITLGTTSLTFTNDVSSASVVDGAGLSYAGSTLNIGAGTGIQVNADTIQIDPAYIGQTSITTLGTIGTGTWNGTVIGSQYGGTGQNFSAGSGILKYTSGTASLVTAPTGAIVGTTDSQTLSGKTIAGTGLLFAGSTSGTTNLLATAIAGTTTLTLPAVTGTLISTGDTGTVTNAMLAGSIANGKLANSTISGVSLGSNLFALTIGSGLTGTSYNGSGAVTIAIDTATVVTLSGSQTLSNKSIAGAGLVFNGSTSGTTNLLATAIAGSTTLTLPAATDTLVGRATTDTLTNKTISGASNTITNIGNSSLTNSSVTVTAGTALSGGGSVSLGGSVTINLNTAKFITRETPSGTINGSNATFTLANTPVAGSESVYFNGILLESGAGNDYTISTNTITMLVDYIPQTGDKIRVSYISQ